MDEIILRVNTSDLAEKMVLSILENSDFKAHTAVIQYNVNCGLPEVHRTNLYPLTLWGNIGTSPSKLVVYSVTAGYGGTGPNAMVAILRAAGFIFDEDDILTQNKMDRAGWINLVYKQ